MNIILAVLITILGLSIGSFLSVLTHRLYFKEKGIVASRSVCPKCKKKLKTRQLIPLISYILLKGKCAYCKKKISIKYPLLEIITALIFLLTFIHSDLFLLGINTISIIKLSYSLILHSFLAALFFYDLLYMEVPDKISLPAIIIALLGNYFILDANVTSSIIAATAIFLFFLIQIILSKGKWVGGGDLRLGALMGAILGLKLGFLALFISYLLGSIIAIILLSLGKIKKSGKMPFGPFLITAIIISQYYGEQLLNLYLNLFNL